MGGFLSKYPQPGDRIEIFRGVYQHWALYVGDGCVVHMVQHSNSKSEGNRFRVVKERLSDVVGDDKWKINNDLDEKYKPRAVEVIVKDALKQVGDVGTYSVITNNCEHFVNGLRYGKHESQQVQEVSKFAISNPVVALMILPVAVGSLSASSSSKKK